MLHVIATIEIQEGQRDEFLEHFRALVPQVLAEDGCIEYGPTIDIETNIGAQVDVRPDVVTVMEKWKSLEALEKHLVAPHMLDYRNQVKALVKTVSLQIVVPA